MAQDGDEEGLNIDSKAFRGPGHLFPLNPAAEGHSNPKIPYSMEGYTAPEKVHTLSPEVHMEINNLSETYKFPRTAFYLQTEPVASSN